MINSSLLHKRMQFYGIAKAMYHLHALLSTHTLERLPTSGKYTCFVDILAA